MATYSNSLSVHPTLTSTTPDVVTITAGDLLEISNRSTDTVLWVATGNVSGLAAAASGSRFVAPGESLLIDRPGDGVVTVVGNGNAYSVEGVSWRIPAV